MKLKKYNKADSLLQRSTIAETKHGDRAARNCYFLVKAELVDGESGWMGVDILKRKMADCIKRRDGTFLRHLADEVERQGRPDDPLRMQVITQIQIAQANKRQVPSVQAMADYVTDHLKLHEAGIVSAKSLSDREALEKRIRRIYKEQGAADI